MARIPETLLALEHADGTAAIVRERDHERALGLVGYVGEPAARLFGHVPSVEPLTDDRLVQGGRLPAGAVGAEVVDDTGRRLPAAAANGVWLVVVDQSPGLGMACPVRCFDESGTTVARPLPHGWTRTPIDDAPELCPACDGAGWDHALGPGGHPELAVCRHCGHEEFVGALSGQGAPPRPRVPAAPDRVDVDVYAAAGLVPRLAGWVGSRNHVHSIVLDHAPDAALTVQTRDADDLFDAEAVVREVLQDTLRDGERWPDRSPAGLAVWLRTRDRRARQIATRAPVVSRTLPVDGRPEDFLFASAGEAWVAVRREGEPAIVVAAKGLRPEDVALERLADPAAALRAGA